MTGGAPREKIGVLLVNLGTPDATDYWSMRRYLAEFLSDRRVIETPRWIWWPILNLIILSFRPKRSGRNYAAIWDKELNEGPLKTITRSQSEKLAQLLSGEAEAGGIGGEPPQILVDWAMRYGNPPIKAGIDKLQAQGCTRLLLVPLYPQYAAATSATVCDEAFEALMEMRWQPALRVAPPYYAEPFYIEALTASLKAELARLDFAPEVILVSFHGVPQAYVDQGDPYFEHCKETWRLLRERLELTPEQCRLSFQSRFGPAKWLQPYTDQTVKTLARQGIKRLAVITPGFAADCLETIEEIGKENRDYFLANGGEKFVRVPCLNDSEAGMKVIFALVKRELAGWV
jgi:ferrochelatase